MVGLVLVTSAAAIKPIWRALDHRVRPASVDDEWRDEWGRKIVALDQRWGGGSALYSVGPNGLDEELAGDDVPVGEVLTPRRRVYKWSFLLLLAAGLLVCGTVAASLQRFVGRRPRALLLGAVLFAGAWSCLGIFAARLWPSDSFTGVLLPVGVALPLSFAGAGALLFLGLSLDNRKRSEPRYRIDGT